MPAWPGIHATYTHRLHSHRLILLLVTVITPTHQVYSQIHSSELSYRWRLNCHVHKNRLSCFLYFTWTTIVHSKLQGKDDTIDLANDRWYIFANWFNTSNLIFLWEERKKNCRAGTAPNRTTVNWPICENEYRLPTV